MEDETFSDIIHKIKRERRSRNDFFNPKLEPSNSDTNFVIKREKEKRHIAEDILKSKRKNNYRNILDNIKHTSNCKYCHSFNKLLRKDKNDLYIYVENNLKYLKLFGNTRYNKSSPSLFIEDYKKRLPQKRMGLVPIPTKKNKSKMVNNYNKLYNLQRSIVMVRRYQYGRKNLSPAPTSKRTYDVSLIQRWWKKISKIILIQTLQNEYKEEIEEELKAEIKEKLLDNNNFKGDISILELGAPLRRFISRYLVGKKQKTDIDPQSMLLPQLKRIDLWGNNIKNIDNILKLIEKFKITVGKSLSLYEQIKEEDEKEINIEANENDEENDDSDDDDEKAKNPLPKKNRKFKN